MLTSLNKLLGTGLDDKPKESLTTQRQVRYIHHKIAVIHLRMRETQGTTKGGRLEMKVTPLGDRILVKMVEMETKTAGGILIPQTAQEKTQEGVVIAVGDDETIKVKAKDRIIYDKYAGTTIKVGGEEQLILKAADVLAKLE
jgi:chaperonin GroES